MLNILGIGKLPFSFTQNANLQMSLSFYFLNKIIFCSPSGMSNLASKLGQIGHKWDKSETFKDQFQCIWARQSQSSPIWGQSDPI